MVGLERLPSTSDTCVCRPISRMYGRTHRREISLNVDHDKSLIYVPVAPMDGRHLARGAQSQRTVIWTSRNALFTAQKAVHRIQAMVNELSGTICQMLEENERQGVELTKLQGDLQSYGATVGKVTRRLGR
jgi:hypothetical protein